MEEYIQTIISGRCGGYPCIAELPEYPAVMISPCPVLLQTAAEDNFPEIAVMPDLPSPMKQPYPVLLQRCLGDSINSGYPVIMQLENVKTDFHSDIRFGSKKVTELYYRGRKIYFAFCNEKPVYYITYYV